MSYLVCGSYQLDLRRPVIMAILNLTPDSFSGDGLAGFQTDAVVRQGELAIEKGAGILDLGGESTRPGSPPVAEAEEIDRIMPALERLIGLGVPVSVDTMKPGVMRAALAAGASMVNDVNGFCAAGAVEVVAGSGAGLCVMHMQGNPQTMQLAPSYGEDVVSEVTSFLRARVSVLQAAGVGLSRICVDPGFGFGKTLAHNMALLGGLGRLAELGLPILAGLSRKSFLGAITGQPPDKRQVASAVGALLAVERGARIVRVHDVEATRDALLLWEALQGSG